MEMAVVTALVLHFTITQYLNKYFNTIRYGYTLSKTKAKQIRFRATYWKSPQIIYFTALKYTASDSWYNLIRCAIYRIPYIATALWGLLNACSTICLRKILGTWHDISSTLRFFFKQYIRPYLQCSVGVTCDGFDHVRRTNYILLYETSAFVE